MSSRVFDKSIKHLIAAFAVLILAMAPGTLRAVHTHPGWVMVRLGARPAEDDHQEAALVVKRLFESTDPVDPISLVFGLLGLFALLSSMIVFPRRATFPPDLRDASLAESGLCAGWSGRAPPPLA